MADDTDDTPGMLQSAEGRLAHVFRRGHLIVGVKTDYPPWGMFDKQGQIVGLEADLAQDLGKRLGLPVRLTAVSTSNRFARLARGQVDVLIATIGDTAARREIVDLLRPHYYASGVRLLAPDSLAAEKWSELAGQSICMTDGAYLNRILVERYGVEPLTFASNRDAQLALQDKRCLGWAYDDTVLARVLEDPRWSSYQITMPVILQTPWAIAVAKGEGERDLGRFIKRAVAQWHRSGWLQQRQEAWGIPPTGFLESQHKRFSKTDNKGRLYCVPDNRGYFPESCLEPEPTPEPSDPVPQWVSELKATTGLDIGPLLNPVNQKRLVTGVWHTVALSAVAIVGSLVAGLVFALAERLGRGILWHLILRWPVRLLVSVARMTPPILQLYIVFFGLGGLIGGYFGTTVSGFMVAAVVFSVYAGASNAAVLSPTLARQMRLHPGSPLLVQVGRSVEQSFEGLVSIMVNIVKAAAMASAIAVPEVISSINQLISEGGDPASLMTLLLVFYFVFVVVVMALLNLLKRWVSP
ncbi:MAG: ABC transporter permease subunit [Alteromonadaceae bacterium]|nr:ABC transporter permease subunit [Alteromonadaceae bacterium]